MHTSFTLLALFLSLPVPGLPDPVWHRSYGEAREVGHRFGRPLAIFVSPNRDNPANVVQDGQLGMEVSKILSEQYVCVVLEPARDRELIAALAITKNAGVVLSDRGGDVQAYHHDGKISQPELVKQLGRYADPTVVVRTTLSNAVQRVSYYPPAAVVTRPTIVQSC